MTDLNDRMREINAELASKTTQAHEIWRMRNSNSQELGIDGRKTLDTELTNVERSITTLEEERRLVERAMKYAAMLEPEPIPYVSPLRAQSQKAPEPAADANGHSETPASELVKDTDQVLKQRAAQQKAPSRRGRPRKTVETPS
jgi:hypothetical protein